MRWCSLWKTAMMQTHENTNQTTGLPDKSPPSVSAASRIVQRKCACGGAAGITDSCGACSNKNLGVISLGPNPLSAGPAASVQQCEAPPAFFSLYQTHTFD